MEGDSTELQNLNPHIFIGEPAYLLPVPAVPPPAVLLRDPPAPPAHPLCTTSSPPGYSTLPEEEESLKETFPKRLDGAFLLFIFVMGCCLQLDRLLFYTCQPYFERMLGLSVMDFQYAAFIRELCYVAAQGQ